MSEQQIVATKRKCETMYQQSNKKLKKKLKNKQVIKLVGGSQGYKDGQGKDASFDNPYGITIYNDQVIVADTWNHRIRLIDIKSRMVSTLAGSGRHGRKDGQGEDASFNHPWGVAIYNDQVVVSDTYNQRIRMIDMKSRMVSTLAGSGRKGWKDGKGEEASFNWPFDVAVYNDQVVVADTWNNRIRLIDIKSRMVSTLAGSGHQEWKDGQGEDASFNWPKSVAVDPMSGQVIIADTRNHSIRLIDIKSGMVSTLAGSGRAEWKDGQGEDASFYNPMGISVYNDQIIVADTWNHRIRLIDINSGMVSTLTGSGRRGRKDGSDASFYWLQGVAVDPMFGQIIAVDRGNSSILIINNCCVGILEWEKDVKQLFLDTYIQNPIVDIILMYCNYNFKRILSSY
jgi:DNA-binding beta-propeller fold protein YncE